MNDKGMSCVEKYGLEVKKVSKIRGAVYIESERGNYLLKKCSESEKHLLFEKEVLGFVKECGIISVDIPVENVEGEIITKDLDGASYVLREWRNLRDCDVRNLKNVYKATEILAVLHKELRNYVKSSENEILYSSIDRGLADEFRKHNQEIKRVRNYLLKKNNKNEFERTILESIDKFYEKAMQSEIELVKKNISGFEKSKIDSCEIVHGTYNYHNVFIDDKKSMVTNFQHMKIGVQLRDLYDFMRKVMEKQKWNIDIGRRMIETYGRTIKLGKKDRDYLKILFMYPEKYWKILNHYYNGAKTWIPDKDVEKLKNVIGLEKNRQAFIEAFFEG